MLAVVVALVAGVAFGPVSLPPGSVAVELLNLIPGVRLHSGLTEREIAIVTELRLPRVVLALLVGGDARRWPARAYQGVFRNPLADPHLLGRRGRRRARGHRGDRDPGDTGDATANLPIGTPLAAFVGALGRGRADLAARRGRRPRTGTPATLILAGVAVSAFLAAGADLPVAAHVDNAARGVLLAARPAGHRRLARRAAAAAVRGGDAA